MGNYNFFFYAKVLCANFLSVFLCRHHARMLSVSSASGEIFMMQEFLIGKNTLFDPFNHRKSPAKSKHSTLKIRNE